MDEIIARKAQDTLRLAAPRSWPTPWTEIQESEVLLGVDLPEGLQDTRLTDDERRSIALALNAILPSEEPLGLWTVVIRCRGVVIDSVLANDV